MVRVRAGEFWRRLRSFPPPNNFSDLGWLLFFCSVSSQWRSHWFVEMLRNDQRHVDGASVDPTGLHTCSQKIWALPWRASPSGTTGGDNGTCPFSCFGLWSRELGGCGHSVCSVTGELERPGGHILLLPKENLEKFGGEPQSLRLCRFGGRFVNLTCGFEAVNAPEAVGKQCGLGEGRDHWVCVSQRAILTNTGHVNDNIYIIFCYHVPQRCCGSLFACHCNPMLLTSEGTFPGSVCREFQACLCSDISVPVIKSIWLGLLVNQSNSLA